MESKNDIEHQLREAIVSSGQSLNQLGQTAGVNDGQLSRFMRGERTLTLETVARLCRVLGLKFCPTDPTGGTDAASSPTSKGGAVSKPAEKKPQKKKGE